MAAPTFALFHSTGSRLADEACEFVCSCDRDGNIIEANESMERLTGYSREEALQMNLGVLLGESWKLSQEQISRPGDPPGFLEITAVAKNGQAVRLRMGRRLATGAELQFQARHDSLTGLPDRSYLSELLDGALREAGGSHTPAVLFVNLDRFQHVNDRLGHAAGDRLLQDVSERLKSALAETDLAGRIGGDEFAVVLKHPACEQDALQAARELLGALRAPYQIDIHELFVTASIGVATFPKHGATAAELLRNADLAMRRAKSHGKNAVEFFRAENYAAVMERLQLEDALRGALDRNEFALVYEPVFNMRGQLEGLEALLTWNHPVLGPLPAGHFIPIAEQAGLIVDIGSWVLRQACMCGARWLASGFRIATISVNVSALQFERGDFVDTVSMALAVTGLPARYLQLELTETYVMRTPSEAALRMSEIRRLGVSIAIDDFGTGYSSLSYLSKFPVDTLKIDQSFLRGMQETAGSLPVIQSIVRLAHSLKLAVVAEGVETVEELELMRLLGCDRAQGRLYGGRLEPEAVEALLAPLRAGGAAGAASGQRT
ncbi:MAG TPA: EAL domain-containing protein [Bryobacteraceae bacterium]|nr:EAL domain-containing protein [Bryobacteraceae bacterium]